MIEKLIAFLKWLKQKASFQKDEAGEHPNLISTEKLGMDIIEEILPQAWNKLISVPEPSLIDLLSEITKKFYGFKPKIEELTLFLKKYESQFLISMRKEVKINKLKKSGLIIQTAPGYLGWFISFYMVICLTGTLATQSI